MSAVEKTFFDEVVAASGLAPVIARFTLARLLLRAGVRDDDLTPDSLARALDELRNGLQVYLGEAEVEQAMSRLRALAGR